jgi:OOP family OmpA-OmpF porin
MKKTLLLPLLLAGTLFGASEYKYELSPMIGYNFNEGNIGLEDNGHFTGGVELQYNYPQSKIAAELSVLYSPDADYKGIGTGDTSITRTLINAVYTFDNINSITPFAKIGAGYEFVSRDAKDYNEDGFVLDAGVGIKIPLTKEWAFKAEAIYLAKVDNRHNQYSDNNLIGLVGFTYSFGAQKTKTVPKVVEVIEETVVIVEKPKVDSDGDGIYDELDKCPNTPAGSTVDVNGCKIVLDDDNDGVPNNVDKCPDTPAGAAVNADGCPVNINFSINFENNSYTVKEASLAKIDEFANFLKKYKNYTAEIVGYTDSRGSEAYNKKLSQKRADEVKRLLIQKGVEASRLTAIGMGELNPVASNATAEGRAQNRRIEANLTLN